MTWQDIELIEPSSSAVWRIFKETEMLKFTDEVPLSSVKLDSNPVAKDAYTKAYQATESLPAQDRDISFDDFKKVEMRVGTVLNAERVPKTSKLVKMQVSFGPIGERQIIAGIGKTFEPDALKGRQCVFVMNLSPRVLHGETSYGMLLAAGSEGALALVTTNGPCLLPDGALVG